AEDGIRDKLVTGVQTCALPIFSVELLDALRPWLEDTTAIKIACDVKSAILELARLGIQARGFDHDVMLYAFLLDADPGGCPLDRSEERRVGKEGRSRWVGSQ